MLKVTPHVPQVDEPLPNLRHVQGSLQWGSSPPNVSIPPKSFVKEFFLPPMQHFFSRGQFDCYYQNSKVHFDMNLSMHSLQNLCALSGPSHTVHIQYLKLPPKRNFVDRTLTWGFIFATTSIFLSLLAYVELHALSLPSAG